MVAVGGWGYFQVSGLGCRCGCGFGYGSQARDLYLNLETRTRDPTAETRDLKMPPLGPALCLPGQLANLSTDQLMVGLWPTDQPIN